MLDPKTFVIRTMIFWTLGAVAIAVAVGSMAIEVIERVEGIRDRLRG